MDQLPRLPAAPRASRSTGRLQGRHPRAGPRRFRFAEHPLQFLPVGGVEPIAVERRHAGQQFVQQYSQRVDIAARIHIQAVDVRLLGTHVQRRTDHQGKPGVNRLVGQPLPDGLGDAKVDDLRHRDPVEQRNQDVAGLDVPMNDPFLMGVLDGLANLDEQRQPLPSADTPFVAVLVMGIPRTNSMTK